MRNLSVAVGLTAVFILSSISSGIAASAYHPANASYRSASSAQMSRAEEPVPSNCVRQSCGKLWCWQMKDGKH